MPKRRKGEAIQDAFDLGIEDPTKGAWRPVKGDPTKGFVRQLRVVTPPMCAWCINETYVTKVRAQRVPNRATHTAFLPDWPEPVAICAQHAIDFANEHGLTRASGKKGKRQ